MQHSPESASGTVLIWGGGGHGKVVADLVRALGHQVAGFVDSSPEKLGQSVEPLGARVLLSQDELLRQLRERGSYPEGITALALGMGDNRARFGYLELLAELPLPPLVHPSAVVSPSARVGRGSVVFAGAILNASARIGAAAIINSGAIIEHDCEIADGAHVSPGAALSGGVRVGERSWIGTGAALIPGIRVGADAMLGAGAVVIRDVPDGATVVGNPARVIRKNAR